jgi:hypothetical protein
LRREDVDVPGTVFTLVARIGESRNGTDDRGGAAFKHLAAFAALDLTQQLVDIHASLHHREALVASEQFLVSADAAVAASDAALVQDQIAVFKTLGGGWRTNQPANGR